MKKLLFSSLLMVVVSTGYCYAEGDSTVESNQKKWSKGDVTVTARLEHKEYSISEPINLKIIISNNSDADIFFVVSQPFKQYKITVTDKEKNKIVPLTPLGKRLEMQPSFMRIVKKIESKNNHVDNLDIKSFFDLSPETEYSISVEGSYLNNSKEFINFKIENIVFTIKKDKGVQEEQ